MDFDTIKKDADKLLDLLIQEGSQRAAARRFGVDHKTIKYWMDQYGITTDDYLNPSNERKEGKKEQKPDYVKKGNYWIVDASHDEVIISEKDLREFKRLYCGDDPLTINQCRSELGMTRRDLYAVKTAFSITHDSIPFTREEVKKKSVEEMTEEDIVRKERQFFKKQEAELQKKALKENKKYKKQEYFNDRIIEKIEKVMDQHNFENNITYDFNIKTKTARTLLINMSDWHKGKLVCSESVWGADGFNKNKYYKYIKKYLESIAYKIKVEKPESVYVLNYGDGCDNPAADQYPNQIKHQDVKYENQFVEFVFDVKHFLEEVQSLFPEIKYSYVKGNHSKGNFNWDLACGKMIEKMFEKIQRIFVDNRQDNIKLHKIYDFNIIQLHGENMPKRLDTPSAKIKSRNLLKMKNLCEDKSYIVQGHYHHQGEEGTGYKRIMLPSMVGGDILSNEKIKVSSRPAQELLIVTENEGLTDQCMIYFD